ncbi:penicillin acylase family protein [Streptomyces sp. KL116D]|uniref:penicillin acylase family protein n=1 Tax=Streptomyces sp. KL116D TaxID=3045152 RepID=UPI0035580B0F
MRSSNAADPSSTSTADAPKAAARTSSHEDVALPDSVRQLDFNSNAWAANGPEVAGGGAMLAGDPHLATTLLVLVPDSAALTRLPGRRRLHRACPVCWSAATSTSPGP